MIRHDRSIKTTRHEVNLRGDGQLTYQELIDIAAGKYAPLDAIIVGVKHYDPPRHEWELQLVWVEQTEIQPPETFAESNRRALREEQENPTAIVDGSHRYQIIIPKQRFPGGILPAQQSGLDDAFDRRLPASYERIQPVTVNEGGDDYILHALVIDTGKPLCHYRDALDEPCVKEADHEDWCRTGRGDEWLPYERRQHTSTPENQEQKND